MSIFEKQRFEIWNQSQHPFRHTLSDFAYTTPAAPVSTLEGAMDWIFAVLYPNTQDAVATPAALPGAGNTLLDYRVVLDDGDGKAAGYRWEQREGEVAPSWHKIYDMDWGESSILSHFNVIAQEQYVARRGLDEVDVSGTILTGLDAGQTVFGGESAGTHLTLNANAGDGTGAQTGYIQFNSDVRPYADSTFTLGTDAARFVNSFFDEVNAGTMEIIGGQITDTSGAISFGDENLSTTGTVTTGTLTAQGGSITDTSGSISFGDENLSTTGTLSAGVATLASTSTIGTLQFADGSITDTGGSIGFADENLSTTGTLSAGATDVTQLDADNIRLDGNTISITDLNGNLNLVANGTGVVDIQSAMTTIGQTITGNVGVTGTHTVTGQFNADNLRIDGNSITSTNVDGDIILDPNGTGNVSLSADLVPDADNTFDIGASGNRVTDIYISNSLDNGTNAFLITELLDMRSVNYRDGARTQPVQTGDAIFWNGTQWLASNPDTEIDHGELFGLLDDDHTQYVLLAGRATGQTIIGGTAASENLTLQSTSNATRGDILFADDLMPTGDNASDLGGASNRIKDIYSTGQAIGLRLQNATTAGEPSASASTVGRVYWNTDVNSIYADVGGTWKKVGAEKYVNQDAVTWDGATSTQTYTVSADISDARFAIWELYDNANSFKKIEAEITKTATQVTVTTSVPLPIGTYTLIGVG